MTMTSTLAPSGSSGALTSRRWPGRIVVSIRKAVCMRVTSVGHYTRQAEGEMGWSRRGEELFSANLQFRGLQGVRNRRFGEGRSQTAVWEREKRATVELSNSAFVFLQLTSDFLKEVLGYLKDSGPIPF